MRRIRNVWAAALRPAGLLLLGACLACGTPGTGAPATSPPEPLVITSDIEYGPGPFNLTDTRAGLSELDSYSVVATFTFDGTIDGTTQNWKRVYSMLATNDPSARRWTIERSGTGTDPITEFRAELGGLEYRAEGPDTCTAAAVREDDLLADRLEPAAFLPAVVGAEEAGSEAVNGITTTHYTFDQRALGEAGMTESSGEFWIASEGGYVVKYVLTRQGKADALGEGVEGVETVAYELTGANEPTEIDLPEDCPPGFIEAPLLPDAAQVERSPGRLTFRTSSSIPEAAAFYQLELQNLGWKPGGEAAVTDEAGFLNFLQGSQQLTLILTLADSQTEVQLLAAPQQSPP